MKKSYWFQTFLLAVLVMTAIFTDVDLVAIIFLAYCLIALISS